MLNIFNVLTGHLYVFSGEMSIQVPSPYFWPHHSSCRTLVPPPEIQPLDLQRILLRTLFFFYARSNLMVWYVCAPSCPTLCDRMYCSLPGSSIHGIFQARVLEWGAISFSRGSSWLRNRTQFSHIVGRYFTIWATREVLTATKSGAKTKYGMCFNTRNAIQGFWFSL